MQNGICDAHAPYQPNKAAHNHKTPLYKRYNALSAPAP
jgi:hypothetical protein